MKPCRRTLGNYFSPSVCSFIFFSLFYLVSTFFMEEKKYEHTTRTLRSSARSSVVGGLFELLYTALFFVSSNDITISRNVDGNIFRRISRRYKGYKSFYGYHNIIHHVHTAEIRAIYTIRSRRCVGYTCVHLL